MLHATLSPISDSSSSTRSLTGQQVGDYVIGDLIGVGGMGRVYEAVAPKIGKRVAIKVLTAERCTDRETVSRFLAEARAVNAIGHRNIVDVFGFGELPDGSCYLVMEYLEGEPFDHLIARRAPLPPSEALGYVEEVLEALAAAHAEGVVHRDIKPSNVFLVRPKRGRPYVKLLDFGAAKLGAATNGLTVPSLRSAVIGTPTYMAPEQALGQPIGPSSDLYGVGGLLFELLTGREVFPAPTPFETMRQHAQEAPPAPSSVLPMLPRALDELVLALLKKKPAERPESADAVRRWCEAVRLMVSSLEVPRPQEASTSRTAIGTDLVAWRLAATPPQTLIAPVVPSVPSLPPSPRSHRAHAPLLAVGVLLLVTLGFAGLSLGQPRAVAQVDPVMVPPPPPVVAAPVAPPAKVAPAKAKPSRVDAKK